MFDYTLQKNPSRGGLNSDLGACPTGEHSAAYYQCGFAGCVDLRLWAKANRYQSRLEEVYRAESSTHVRGDGRWYVEILCKRHIAALGQDIQHHQTDGEAEIFRCPIERLDEVAAILKPRKRRTGSSISPERQRLMQERRKTTAQVGQNGQERTKGADKDAQSYRSPYVTISG